MRKETLYGKEGREKALEGIRKIAKAVKVTLGPLGRNVLIINAAWTNDGIKALPLHSTKDGFTTTKAFRLDDPFENAGAQLVQEAAQKTVDQAGDGTTTTVLLMEAIAEAGVKLVNDGVNPVQLKREIDEAVAYVVEKLKESSIQIGDDNEKIFNIATISANNDPEMGRLIADAFKIIGNDGVIDIEAGVSVKTEVKTAEGYRFENGYLHPLFVNKPEKQICEFENPLIVLYEKTITHHDQFTRVIQIAQEQERPVLFICEDAREAGLGVLVVNKLNSRFPNCVVKAPGYGESRRQDMEDLAILTGGTYMSDSKGVGLKDIEFENFGSAKKVIISKDETVIIGGRSDKKTLTDLLNTLKMDLTRVKNEDEAAPIEKRIAKLQGGVAVIQVGAPTETEMKERMDRFDDAVRATKAAIAEGYVSGGGKTYCNIALGHMGIACAGTELIRSALWKPFQQICLNAGRDSADVASPSMSVIDSPDGYNAKTDKVENLIEAGVIDPTKVLRCALQNAASSATMFLITEALIADIA